MNKTRESGSYWIKLRGEDEFIIAKWDDNVWTVDGYYCPPPAIEEIDERRIVREEPLHPNYTGFSGNIERIPKNE